VDGHRPPPENRCAGPLRVRAGPANQQRNGDSAMSKVLIESVENGVCTLTMNRVERRNALSPELLSALVDAVARASADDAVGAIVLRGNGGYFCVGGDVKAMAEGSGRDLGFEGRVDALRARMEVSRLLHQSAKPTIAAITGAAAGAGLSIAMACDFRVAGRSAKLTTAFAKVGLSGDFGGTWFPEARGGAGAGARPRLVRAGPEGREGAGARAGHGSRGRGGGGGARRREAPPARVRAADYAVVHQAQHERCDRWLAGGFAR